jgi:hypothetical protein
MLPRPQSGGEVLERLRQQKTMIPGNLTAETGREASRRYPHVDSGVYGDGRGIRIAGHPPVTNAADARIGDNASGEWHSSVLEEEGLVCVASPWSGGLRVLGFLPESHRSTKRASAL